MKLIKGDKLIIYSLNYFIYENNQKCFINKMHDENISIYFFDFDNYFNFNSYYNIKNYLKKKKIPYTIKKNGDGKEIFIDKRYCFFC